MELGEIVKEIERIGVMYRGSDNDDAKKTYEQYIGLVITEADEPQQYNLCDYWERLKI